MANKKFVPETKISLERKITRALTVYLKTQFLLMTIVAMLTWIALTLIGVQLPILLALITGALSVVPVLGILVSAIIASLVAMFDNIRFLPDLPVIAEAVAVIVLYGVLNSVTDYFLSPLIVGKSTGMHPVLLLVAVLAGTVLFGIRGTLLTMPVLLVTKVAIEHYREQQTTNP